MPQPEQTSSPQALRDRRRSRSRARFMRSLRRVDWVASGISIFISAFALILLVEFVVLFTALVNSFQNENFKVLALIVLVLGLLQFYRVFQYPRIYYRSER